MFCPRILRQCEWHRVLQETLRGRERKRERKEGVKQKEDGGETIVGGGWIGIGKMRACDTRFRDLFGEGGWDKEDGEREAEEGGELNKHGDD